MNNTQNKLGYSFEDYFDAFQNYFVRQVPTFKTLKRHNRAEWKLWDDCDTDAERQACFHIFTTANYKHIRADYFLLVLRGNKFSLCVGKLTLYIDNINALAGYTPDQLFGKVIAIQQAEMVFREECDAFAKTFNLE